MEERAEPRSGGSEGEDAAGRSVRLTRPYSHSDLGFRRWDNQLARDAGCCLGLDFGGTLSKIVFFQPEEMPNFANSLADFLLKSKSYGGSGVRDDHLSFYSEKMGGTLHFINFETSHTNGAIKMLQNVQHNIKRVHATGGGAFKYNKLIKDKLGIRLMKQDELRTVVRGIIFTLLEHPDSECYTYEPILDGTDLEETSPKHKRHHGVSHVDALSYEMAKVVQPMKVTSSSFFPLLVVNIGSGVSIINVTGPNTFRRVSGTAIGGATYYGLCKLLCRCNTFDEAMDLAELGDSRDVNLTVQDIYGGSYEQAGLSGEITASFFGKAASAAGNVRTKRSRKRPYVSVLERLGLVLISLLCANLVAGMRERVAGGGEPELVDVVREAVLLLIPAGIAYLVFWSSEARLASSHPPNTGPLRPADVADRSSASTGHAAAAGTGKPGASGRGGSVREGGQPASFEEADIARALVVMVAQNVTQIAFLNAKVYKSKRVLFTGNFLRHNRIALRALSSMMHNWSQGEIQALFMEHEGYFGAVGTFLYSCGVSPAGDHLHDHLEGDEAPTPASAHMDTVPEGADEGDSRRNSLASESSAGASRAPASSAGAGGPAGEAGSQVEGRSALEVASSPSITSSDDEEKNVIEDLLFKGEFPRRRSTRLSNPLGD